MVDERLLHRDRNWLDKTGATLGCQCATGWVHWQDALWFQQSTCYKKWRTLCSFDLFRSEFFRFSSSAVGNFPLSVHSRLAFHALIGSFGWTGTWKEPLKCCLVLKRLLYCSSGVDLSMNSNLSSHLHVFGIHWRCRNDYFFLPVSRVNASHKKAVATLSFKDKTSFRCFSALSQAQNI